MREPRSLPRVRDEDGRYASKYVDPFQYDSNREEWIDGNSDESFTWFLHMVSPADMSREEQWLYLQMKAGMWPTKEDVLVQMTRKAS